MTTAHALDDALSRPNWRAIAAAAHDRLQAQAGQDLSAKETAQRRVAEAASATIRRRRGTECDRRRQAHPGQLRARRALKHGRAAADHPRGEAQARGRQRIRTGHRSRRADRTLTPRDRHRRGGLARNRPRDPRPQQRKPKRGPGRIGTENRSKSGVGMLEGWPAGVSVRPASAARRLGQSRTAARRTPWRWRLRSAIACSSRAGLTSV
jgi:hypothetical protein